MILDDKKLLQLSRYEDSQIRISDDETAINYVKDNINLIRRVISCIYMKKSLQDLKNYI